MSTHDDSLAIIAIGSRDLIYHVCESIWNMFNGFLVAFADEFKNYHLSKDKKVAKQQKAFQLKLREIYIDPSHIAYTNFYNDMTSRMKYLGELVQQLINLHIKIFSKIRPKSIDSIEISSFDEKEFVEKLLSSACFSFFHDTRKYCEAYACRNKNKIKDTIESNCNDILNKLASAAYEDLFKKKVKSSNELEVEEKLLDNIIGKTTVESAAPAAQSAVQFSSAEFKEISIDKSDMDNEKNNTDSTSVDTKEINRNNGSDDRNNGSDARNNGSDARNNAGDNNGSDNNGSDNNGSDNNGSDDEIIPEQPVLVRQTNKWTDESDDELLSRV